MKNLIWVFLFVVNVSFAQKVIPLYEGEIPNNKPTSIKEISETNKEGTFLISHVSQPTLTVFEPQNSAPNHAVVVICPGGAYGVLASKLEGDEVAKVLSNWGITAFVLKYRLPDDAIMKDKSIAPLQDVQRALQMIRENASAWKIDPAKVGVLGFSAGGHLAASASVHFEKVLIENPKQTSVRPDFSILVYPVISFTDSLTHMGSRENLLGKNPSEEEKKYYSNELQVTSKTPPTFLVHAEDDDLVSVRNTLSYYDALLKNKVEVEMHIYPHGGHGFGLKNPSTPALWTDSLKLWMQSNKWL